MASPVKKRNADLGRIDEIYKRIMPTAQENLALQVHSQLRAHIKSNLRAEIERTFLGGSYARSTNIKDHSDVDVEVVFTEAAAERLGYKGLHTRLRSIGLPKELSSTGADLKTRHQDKSVGVAVKFYGRDVNIDFVPLVPSGSDYVIIDTSGRKRTRTLTNPEKDAMATKEACKNDPTGQLRKVIRLLKAWNYSYGDDKPLKSFHIECILIEYFRPDPSESLDSLLNKAFTILQGYYNDSTLAAPGGGAPLYTYIAEDQQREAAIRRSLELARREIADSNWEKVFLEEKTHDSLAPYKKKRD